MAAAWGVTFMGLLICVLLRLFGPSAEALPPGTEGSYLYQPAFCMDYALRQPAVPYRPQPGDLFMCTVSPLWAKLGHRGALTAAPQHSGIVILAPDGRPALLESGPHNSLHVEISDLIPELQSYAVGGERVWIRRRRVPLTIEQSARLTAFAMKADGKRYAIVRMFGQLTPFRSRGPLRTYFMGGPHGERPSYFCSELVLECCVAAGLLDPVTTRPAATYPRDLFFGRSLNLYIDKHLDLSAWDPPARWTLCPGAEPPLSRHRRILDGDSR